MSEICAIGEILIDFTPCGKDAAGSPVFVQNPGGAPANVLVMAARLGASAGLLAKAGQDGFGRFLRDILVRGGVDVTGLLLTREAGTTLAFVHLDDTGDRSFSFYRDGCADTLLREDELDEALLDGCKVLHFGGVSLTGGPCVQATLGAARRARAAGKLVSYDPNYRPLLWSDEAAAATKLRDALFLAHLVKVSEEELLLLTGERDLLAGARALAAYGPKLVLISRGAQGAAAWCAGHFVQALAYQVQVVDTTGAGDAFLGSILYLLRDTAPDRLNSLDEEQLLALLRFGNAAGSLTTTRMGAIPALPTGEEIRALQSKA